MQNVLLHVGKNIGSCAHTHTRVHVHTRLAVHIHEHTYRVFRFARLTFIVSPVCAVFLCVCVR